MNREEPGPDSEESSSSSESEESGSSSNSEESSSSSESEESSSRSDSEESSSSPDSEESSSSSDSEESSSSSDAESPSLPTPDITAAKSARVSEMEISPDRETSSKQILRKYMESSNSEESSSSSESEDSSSSSDSEESSSSPDSEESSSSSDSEESSSSYDSEESSSSSDSESPSLPTPDITAAKSARVSGSETEISPDRETSSRQIARKYMESKMKAEEEKERYVDIETYTESSEDDNVRRVTDAERLRLKDTVLLNKMFEYFDKKKVCPSVHNPDALNEFIGDFLHGVVTTEEAGNRIQLLKLKYFNTVKRRHGKLKFSNSTEDWIQQWFCERLWGDEMDEEDVENMELLNGILEYFGENQRYPIVDDDSAVLRDVLDAFIYLKSWRNKDGQPDSLSKSRRFQLCKKFYGGETQNVAQMPVSPEPAVDADADETRNVEHIPQWPAGDNQVLDAILHFHGIFERYPFEESDFSLFVPAYFGANADHREIRNRIEELERRYKDYMKRQKRKAGEGSSSVDPEAQKVLESSKKIWGDGADK